MPIRIGRILIGAVLAEFLAVLALVLIVAVFGPSDQAAAEAYAQRLGYWVGPLAGFVFTLIAGWWVAKNLTNYHLANGFVLGVAVAVIDISILVASGSGFQLIFAVSNIGRVIAGSIGGWLAGRSVQDPA